jgi:IS1 family transposase
MEDDAIDSICHTYEKLKYSLKHLKREMTGYKSLLTQLRKTDSWDEYQRVRMDADILAKSISYTEKEIERYESKLADQFVDHKPFTGSVESESYYY